MLARTCSTILKGAVGGLLPRFVNNRSPSLASLTQSSYRDVNNKLYYHQHPSIFRENSSYI